MNDKGGDRLQNEPDPRTGEPVAPNRPEPAGGDGGTKHELRKAASAIHRWGTLLIQAGTLVLVYRYAETAKKQWMAMQVANENAKAGAIAAKSLEVGDRAWVEVVKLGNLPPLQAGKPTTLNAVIRNGGRTPAFKVENFGRIVWGPDPLPDDYFATLKEQPKPAQSFIGIGAEYPLGLSATLDTEAVKAIRDGRWNLFAIVNITYTDVIHPDRARRTEICGRYDPLDGQWKTCSNNNRMD